MHHVGAFSGHAVSHPMKILLLMMDATIVRRMMVVSFRKMIRKLQMHPTTILQTKAQLTELRLRQVPVWKSHRPIAVPRAILWNHWIHMGNSAFRALLHRESRPVCRIRLPMLACSASHCKRALLGAVRVRTPKPCPDKVARLIFPLRRQS
jgi:hypothetical protein